MNRQNNIIKLDLLIKDYRLIEENIFIGRVTDIALEDKELVIAKIQLILKEPKTGIHLKYLLLIIIPLAADSRASSVNTPACTDLKRPSQTLTVAPWYILILT